MNFDQAKQSLAALNHPSPWPSFDTLDQVPEMVWTVVRVAGGMSAIEAIGATFPHLLGNKGILRAVEKAAKKDSESD